MPTPTAPYSPRFSRALSNLLKTEGGFVDDPHDRGGATKYGISLRFLLVEGRIDTNRDGFADFDLDMDGDIDGADVRKLTTEQAGALYWRCFWLPVRAEDFARPLGEALFDQAVNGGLLGARKLLQKAINACSAKMPGGKIAPLAVDGKIGPATIETYQRVLTWPALGMPSLIGAYRAAAAARYRAIVDADPSQRKFLAGWLVRAGKLGAE